MTVEIPSCTCTDKCMKIYDIGIIFFKLAALLSIRQFIGLIIYLKGFRGQGFKGPSDMLT